MKTRICFAPDMGGGMGEAAREDALRRREAEISRREMRAQAMEQLSAAQMPAELADLLDYGDGERFAASLERLKRGFSQAVQRGVEARVAGGAPRTGTGKGGAGTLKQAIASYYRL